MKKVAHLWCHFVFRTSSKMALGWLASGKRLCEEGSCKLDCDMIIHLQFVYHYRSAMSHTLPLIKCITTHDITCNNRWHRLYGIFRWWRYIGTSLIRPRVRSDGGQIHFWNPLWSAPGSNILFIPLGVIYQFQITLSYTWPLCVWTAFCWMMVT